MRMGLDRIDGTLCLQVLTIVISSNQISRPIPLKKCVAFPSFRLDQLLFGEWHKHFAKGKTFDCPLFFTSIRLGELMLCDQHMRVPFSAQCGHEDSS